VSNLRSEVPTLLEQRQVGLHASSIRNSLPAFSFPSSRIRRGRSDGLPAPMSSKRAFPDDFGKVRGARADRPCQGIAAERAKADAFHARTSPGNKGSRSSSTMMREPPRSTTDAPWQNRAARREYPRPKYSPDIELGPVGQGKHPHRLALFDPGVEKLPEFRPLIARIPGMRGERCERSFP